MKNFFIYTSVFKQKSFISFIISGLLLGLVGCATTKDSANQSTTQNPEDPYENVNRKVYNFNDKVDTYVAKPVADAYKYITPDFIEIGVSNFFNNVKNVNVVVNDLLQGKLTQTGRDTGRFLMNTTLGMVGIFDVAKTVGLEQNEEDFEQTLAVWGVPQGTYIVLPLLGPITTRGIPGAAFDTAANPINYVGFPLQALSLVNTRANAEGALKFIDEAALDPYVFTRESFLQWRKNLATDGKIDSSSDLSDFDPDSDPSADKQSITNKPENASKMSEPTSKKPTSSQ